MKQQLHNWSKSATLFCLLLLLGLSVAAVSHPKPQQVGQSDGTMRGGVALSPDPLNHPMDVGTPPNQASFSYCAEPQGPDGTNGWDEIMVSAQTILKGISLADLVGGTILGAMKPLLVGLCDGYKGVVNQFGGGDAQFLYGTGPLLTYDDVAVRNLWGFMAGFAGVLLTLLFAIAGIEIMLGSVSPRVVLPRLLFSFLAIFAFWQLLPRFIDLSNLLCHQILHIGLFEGGGSTIDITSVFTQGHSVFEVVNGFQFAWLGTLVIVILSFFLLLVMLARIGFLDLLIVVSPIMLLCYWHPGWQRWANTWLSLFLVALFVQPIQILAMTLGIGLLNVFGSGSLISILVGIAVLFMVLKIPAWLNSTVGHAFGSVGDTLGAFKRDMVQNATFALRIAGFAAGGPIGGAAAGVAGRGGVGGGGRGIGRGGGIGGGGGGRSPGAGGRAGGPGGGGGRGPGAGGRVGP
jgi:hypothetical protein